MVQQTDSMFTQYLLSNSDSAFPKHDNTTTVTDLPNQTSHGTKHNPPPVVVEPVKLAGLKRPPQQTPATHNAHLVYVRRKTESEQHKNNTPNDQPHENNSPHYPMKHIPQPKTLEAVSGNSNTTSPVPDSACLHLDTTTKGLIIHHWEERYLRLNKVLNALDLSDQHDYRQMLHSLSSVGLSRVALELEKRSIQLSIEEAREVQRAKLMDVLDKFPIKPS